MTKKKIEALLQITGFPYKSDIIKSLYNNQVEFPYHGRTFYLNGNIRNLLYAELMKWPVFSTKPYSNYSKVNILPLYFLALLRKNYPEDPLLDLILQTRCWENREDFLEMFKLLREKIPKS